MLTRDRVGSNLRSALEFWRLITVDRERFDLGAAEEWPFTIRRLIYIHESLDRLCMVTSDGELVRVGFTNALHASAYTSCMNMQQIMKVRLRSTYMCMAS